MSCIDPNAVPKTGTTISGSETPKKTSWSSAARPVYSTPMPGEGPLPLNLTGWYRNGEVGPIMLGRDHHDPGGTDSPFRETANIKDGSNVCADMATHCFAGNAARGMSLVALHNGGGTGIGKAINGGFGLVLDGSDRLMQSYARP